MKAIVTLLVAALIIAAIFGAVVWLFMILWNAVMPLFGIITLTYWQSLALLVMLNVVGSALGLRYRAAVK